MIDQKTRELIQLYMEFSDHKSLTVKEFLMFRKEALKECTVLPAHQTRNLSVEPIQASPVHREPEDKITSREVKGSTVSEVKSAPDNIVSDDMTDYDADLLALIRSIDD